MSDPEPPPPSPPSASSPQPGRPQRPPPIPPQAIQYASPGARPPTSKGLDEYQRVADTVGMVPSLRWKDNVIQLVCVVAGAIIGAGVGYFIAGQEPFGAVIGAILGLVAALFVSGIVLMILGFVRARKR